MELIAVVAMTENRIIATEDGIPWNYPEDEQQYKKRVSEHPIIIGRVTYESMSPDLPGSQQIVLSRSLSKIAHETAIVVDTASSAISTAVETGTETTYVIGGAKVYEALFNDFDSMIITVVDDTVKETNYTRIVKFPNWDRSQWKKRHVDESYNGFRIEFWDTVRSD